MSGPACEILLHSLDGSVLDMLDEILASHAGRIERTRRGRAWSIWIEGQPFHVQVDENSATVAISAGCNGPDDYARVRDLQDAIAIRFGGVASRLEK